MDTKIVIQKETIYLTVEWYKSYQNNKDMEDITKKQILFL